MLTLKHNFMDSQKDAAVIHTAASYVQTFLGTPQTALARPNEPERFLLMGRPVAVTVQRLDQPS
jgi:hypothetical protein